MLVDVFSKGITGKEAEAALGKAGITVNKNAIPFDRNPPMVASGIRIGTPAVTTRGMREAEMDVDRRPHRRVLASPDDDRVAGRSRPKWSALCEQFPLHPSRRPRSRRGDRGPPPRRAGARRRSFAEAARCAAHRRIRGARRTAGDGGSGGRRDREGGTLLAEAGTGTGKTLAYLIPAILSRQRVLVSTGTKNLQEQIFFKDIPALRDALGVPFTATLMKGRGNYLCLHRWEMFRDGVLGGTSAAGRLIESGDRMLLPIIDEWLKTTTDGDRAGLRELPEDLPLWRELAAEADTCLGTECPRYGDCFVTLMRQRAAESDVVIINHHLLCADAAVRQGEYGEVVPACPTLVVDEAHQLEDVATQYFGVAVSNPRRGAAARRRPAAGRGAPPAQRSRSPNARPAPGRVRVFWRTSEHVAVDASGGTARVRRHARRVFGRTADRCRSRLDDGRSTLDGRSKAWRPRWHWPRHGRRLTVRPASCRRRTSRETLCAARRRTPRRPAFPAARDDPGFVYFLERRGRGLYLRAAPIDVSRRGPRHDPRPLPLGRPDVGDADGGQLVRYVKGRLGIREASELCVPSEFDYTSQALLYLPRRMPRAEGSGVRPGGGAGGDRAPPTLDAAARSCSSPVTRSCATCSGSSRWRCRIRFSFRARRRVRH